MKRLIAGAIAAGLLAAASPAVAQEKLTVWWVKGFYKAEDEALFEAIKKYETRSGIKVDMSQYAVQDMIPKTVAALDAGTPPDVAYADVYRFPGRGQVGFRRQAGRHFRRPQSDEGDVSRRTRWRPPILYNDKAKKKAYYAFPLKQQTMHIQYWIDMLDQAGFKESDIPKTWKEYWSFWCDKVQAGLPEGDRHAQLRDRPADGRQLVQLLLFVPDFHGRL